MYDGLFWLCKFGYRPMDCRDTAGIQHQITTYTRPSRVIGRNQQSNGKTPCMLGTKMKRAAFVVAMLAGWLAGCATLSSVTTSSAEKRFDSGVRALASGDYATAHKDLAWVAEHYPDKDEGQRALLILAALEMDPRNPARRAEVGADLAATFLRLPERDSWVDPVAQTMYLLGLELGAAEERAQRAERAAEAQRELPKLPGPTVSARIKSIEQERDRLQVRVTSLEEQVGGLQRELERIRKTIKP
jgi:hypothetical protein